MALETTGPCATVPRGRRGLPVSAAVTVADHALRPLLFADPGAAGPISRPVGGDDEQAAACDWLGDWLPARWSGALRGWAAGLRGLARRSCTCGTTGLRHGSG